MSCPLLAQREAISAQRLAAIRSGSAPYLFEDVLLIQWARLCGRVRGATQWQHFPNSGAVEVRGFLLPIFTRKFRICTRI